MQDYQYIRHRSERPGYAGTAIFYKKELPIKNTYTKFSTPSCFNDDGRVTAIEWEDFLLLNIYFPNG